MSRLICPAPGIAGEVTLPGDKSISHRYAMLSAVASGRSVLENYATGEDCASTLACLRSLGVRWEREGDRVTIEGRGPDGLQPPSAPLDAGNSGTTMRMLSGILAGQPFASVLQGDASLSKRPMSRIIAPLRQMGARIDGRDGQFPPLSIRGGGLRAVRYELPVASAQVKSCVLLAGLFAPGETVVVEPVETRDHTEIALRRLGAALSAEGGTIAVRGPASLSGQGTRIPSDISSAVFFLAAALLLPGSDLRIRGVGLNPTRAAVLQVLRRMGARIEVRPEGQGAGELEGTLRVRGGLPLEGGEIAGATTAAVIDEIPMLAVLGATSKRGLRIRDGRELRVKETDRIEAVVTNLRRMGADVSEFPDGMAIRGGCRLRGAQLDSFGDHRVAMAFAVAALAADSSSQLRGAGAAAVSFPEFFSTLESVSA